MPKNEDLIKSIEAEAETKGVDVPKTDGKSNEQLAAILSELKQTAPAPDPTKDATPDDEPVKRPPFYICDGKSLTTKAGLKGPGDEVKVEYLSGGKDRIAELIKSGVIAKG